VGVSAKNKSKLRIEDEENKNNFEGNNKKIRCREGTSIIHPIRGKLEIDLRRRSGTHPFAFQVSM
jgi:hypothetical protein